MDATANTELGVETSEVLRKSNGHVFLSYGRCRSGYNATTCLKACCDVAELLEIEFAAVFGQT